MFAPCCPTQLIYCFVLIVFISVLCTNIAVVTWAGQWTCNSQVAGSSFDWAPLHRGIGQATYTCVPLTPSSIIWYQPSSSDLMGDGKVTAGLVEINGSLSPGLWLMSPAGWLPRNRDQLRAQQSQSSTGLLYSFLHAYINKQKLN